MYIYIDESEGDVLVIVAVVTDHPKELKNVLKRTRHAKLAKRLRTEGELKAARASDKFKRHLYTHLADLKEPRIYTIQINKKKIPRHLQDKGGFLYLSMMMALLEACIPKKTTEIFVYPDKRPLKDVLPIGLVTTLSHHFQMKFSRATRFEVHPTDSQTDLGVQVADFVANAMFQKYEHGNMEWSDMIKKLVVEEIDALKVL